MPPKVIVIDTSGFFAPTERLKSIILQKQVGEERKLVTLDLVVFEFLKVIEEEMNKANGKGNQGRVRVLQSVRDHFSSILQELDIEIKTGDDFTVENVEEAYSLISRGHESGDSMIWMKMQKLGFDTILTNNVRHWKRLGARVLPVSVIPNE